MDFNVENTTIHNFPHAFISKRGEPILVTTLDDKRAAQLVDMYLAYEPRNSFQGLPPIGDQACINWVQHMIREGLNLVALSFGEGVAGHVAVFPIDRQRCELLLVVSPPLQNTGIGTQLAHCSIQLGHELGFELVRLSVDATNVRARHVYKKCGFDYLSKGHARELEMALDLRRVRDAFSVNVAEIMNTNVIAVHVGQPCREVLDIFLHQSVATVPVVDQEQELMGIISEIDLMLPSNIDRRVSDVLTREVVTVQEHCKVSRVIRMFQSKKMRCIPVVDDHMKLVGIVGRKDILAYYAKHFC